MDPAVRTVGPGNLRLYVARLPSQIEIVPSADRTVMDLAYLTAYRIGHIDTPFGDGVDDDFIAVPPNGSEVGDNP